MDIYLIMYDVLKTLQTLLLAILMKHFGNKRTLLFGLLFETLQLFMIGFGSTAWYVTSLLFSALYLTPLLSSFSVFIYFLPDCYCNSVCRL